MGVTSNRDIPNVSQAIARAVEPIFLLPHPKRYRDRDTHVNNGVIRSGEQLGCCNMRVPIAGGTLAIGLRGERGGDRGAEAKWSDITAKMNMARQGVLLAAALGQ